MSSQSLEYYKTQLARLQRNRENAMADLTDATYDQDVDEIARIQEYIRLMDTSIKAMEDRISQGE